MSWRRRARYCVRRYLKTHLFWRFYRTPAPDRDQALVARLTARCAAHFWLLDEWLEARDEALHALVVADASVSEPVVDHYRTHGLTIIEARALAA